ncbi:hypothetical protein VPH35_114565 [Triticum aestivum]|uniref:putative wall-associated receptor kinase-like 16 n=1 Tax=Triticum aestivum TaxID=4565 RepID=UPI001D010C4C|nr:putative wall-associated receptor kinase-like 16 [Triticum aestivum]
MTPDSVLLLCESISAYRTPSLHYATPPRSAAINDLQMDYQGSNVTDFLHANGHVMLERVDNNCNLRSFTRKEIDDITSGYSTVLGEGGFGKVYKGRLDGLCPVAVKIYKNGTKKKEFAKEVIVHSQINHKNIVRLFGCCIEENALAIVMEFVHNGNLYNILHCSNAKCSVPFPLDKRLDIAIESAEVLSCMHSMYSPVLHGDIKPANILLDVNLRPKISDFGIARLLAADATHHTRYVVGCIGYMDPLFCRSGILTPKSDVYSFGVVLLEIITRKKAVDGDIILAQSFDEALRNEKHVRQMFDQEIANDKKNVKFLEDVTKLAAECLKMEDKMRPEMAEVANKLRTIKEAYHQSKVGNSTGPSFIEAARRWLARGTTVLVEGGCEKVFKQTFKILPDEQLKISHVCCLSTSAGPLMGVMYISTAKMAFCSDNPLSYKVENDTKWSYYTVTIPLRRLRTAKSSVSTLNSSEKYIQIVSVEGHELWFMGFLKYDKAISSLQEALVSSRCNRRY